MHVRISHRRMNTAMLGGFLVTTAWPQVADGAGGFHIWRVADKGWFSSLGVDRGANNSEP
jgi:hypothetical protein